MKRTHLIHRLNELEALGIYVLAKRDLEKLFPEEDEKAMEKSLQRAVSDGILARPAHGLYINPAAASRKRGWVIEELARALRPGKICYVSLESMLSEYGAISQIPMSRLTIMTTGSSGLTKTPFGEIEYTHTKRSEVDILINTIEAPGRPLRIATRRTALRDLVRVGRNVDMVDLDELADDDAVPQRLKNSTKAQSPGVTT